MPLKKQHPLLKLIEEGEHQQLDFKFEISDAEKISRTFVAFANTEGGKLLIGVNDDGSIAGTQAIEEEHMAVLANNKFISPPIIYKTKTWNLDGKQVLEIQVEESNQKPHFVKSRDKMLAYLRIRDKNIQASNVWILAMQKKYSHHGTFISYSERERELLKYLESHDDISLGGIMELLATHNKDAQNILADFIALDIIEILFTGEDFVYRLK